ncbi:pyridoxal phosphate-dependent aminotransferase [Pseudalkalibacillus decolorationis]|uniref:pyridoxal phosphate-dependent aminotransferase n=1 Tax=Pseudalkalibacillus decolorationis TaxID=163879 RepID=UPI0021478E47|nr:pyridoxal phosphate-dependent aminotransferase [Pseudalkalibacillus decolorationis]
MKHFDTSDVMKRLPTQFFAKLVGKAAKVAADGHDIINLGQGNPDQPTPSHIVSAMQTATENPQYHKYSPFQGYDFLKEAIATFYKREYDVNLDPKTEVAILFGGKVGLVEISQCLLNAGDLALVPDPGYPDYLSGISMANARIETMALNRGNNFLPDYSKLSEQALSDAKLMFLNYPNNPTAGVATADFFAETVSLAEEHNICVLHDFAYGGIGFNGKKPVSFLQAAGAKDTGVEIYTMSKTYNMAGWRVGFVLGNQSVIKMINTLQDHFYVSLFGAVQEAAAAALLGPQDCVEDLVKTYQSRRDVFINGLQEIGWNVKAPEGSFFAWLPVPEGYSSESFADLLLEKAHVVVAPGVGFGENGEGYVRAGLLTSEERLQEAVDRIRRLHLFD